MSADQLFQIVNTSVLPAWLLLAILPRWRFTQPLVFGIVIPLLALVYTAVLVSVVAGGGDGFEAPDFSSLEGVQALLGNEWGLVAGWTHYLAFDLFVGAWIVRDAPKSGVPHLLTIPALFFTLMAGPFGLILYLVIRSARRKEAIATPA